MEEQDASVSLLDRLLDHARATAQYNVYFGRGRDALRRARPHGAREPLQRRERHLPRPEHAAGVFALQHVDARPRLGDARLRRAARVPRHAARATRPTRRCCSRRRIATCDHYIDEVTAADGIPYWDAGAPGLASLPDWRDRAADPFNEHEPVDSSAAAIARAGTAAARARSWPARRGSQRPTSTCRPACACVETLFEESGPYLSIDPKHQGLLLHSVYHWPNRWDHVPPGATTPRGESSQWGDYHAREAGALREAARRGGPYLAFFGPQSTTRRPR